MKPGTAPVPGQMKNLFIEHEAIDVQDGILQYDLGNRVDGGFQLELATTHGKSEGPQSIPLAKPPFPAQELLDAMEPPPEVAKLKPNPVPKLPKRSELVINPLAKALAKPGSLPPGKPTAVSKAPVPPKARKRNHTEIEDEEDVAVDPQQPQEAVVPNDDELVDAYVLKPKLVHLNKTF